MKIFFFSPVHFEDWDWRNSVEKGIGGSETSHVEMAWRLAQRGHEVVSYAPIPPDCPGEWRGTFWKRYEEADFTQDGLWVLYRCPDVLDRFGPRRAEQPRWLMCQDTHYGSAMTEARAAKLDRVLALCHEHVTHLQAIHPFLGDKLWLTSNGVKMDLIRTVGIPARNPKRLMYASSPDRGLIPLLSIFARAREIVADLELHIYYGFENIDKLLATKASWTKFHLAGIKEAVEAGMRQPGVTWHGRVSQGELYQAWLSSGLWVYPTDFTETSCITCMEAQALGAIPITRPLWALADNVRHGVYLDGSPANDPLVRARYAGEIIRLTTQAGLQDRIRQPMMEQARHAHNWERWVDQWEATLRGHDGPLFPYAQSAFQHKWMRGRTLNVGCDTDFSGLRRRGAVNLDVRAISPVTKQTNAHDILHDAREPYPACLGTFDTVILGEILEHVSHADGIRMLANAAAILNPGGQVVLTVPDDGDRECRAQHVEAVGDETYAEGSSAFHTRAISRADVEAQVSAAGLKTTVYQPIDYTLFEGHGIVAER